MMTRFMLVLLTIHVTGAKEEHSGWALSTEMFMETLESSYFVDKTELIRIFFELGGEEHMVFHGPKRFGKTVNMNMIQEFVEIETDENGYIANRNNLAKRNVFKKLAIGQDKEVFSKYFAAFPVIHFTFNIAPKSSYDHFLRQFASMITTEYERQKCKHYFHGHGFNRPKQAHAGDHELVWKFQKYTRDISDDDLLDAGVALARLLKSVFNRPAILLVDEYDVPITQALLNPNISNDEAEKITEFLAEFLKKLVKSGQGLVERSLLTGVTRVSYTYEINNLQFHRIFDDPKIAPYYGFTREEVINLTKKFSVEDKIDAITDYYDGFKIENGSSMFFMQSVMQFLNTGKLTLYWDPYDRYFDSFFEFEQMGSYLDANIDKEIHFVMKDKIEKADLLLLKKYMKRKNITEYRSPTFNLILQMMVDGGVFTIVEHFDENSVSVKITNIEVRRQLSKRIYTLEFYLKKFKIPTALLENFLISTRNLENDKSRFIEFKNAINAFLNQIQPLSEASMQSALCGPLQIEALKGYNPGISFASVGGRVKNVPEKHNKSGLTTNIYDCLYVVRNLRKEYTGIILELKYKQESSRLALTQILDRKYFKTFDRELKKMEFFNLTTKVLIGIHYDPGAKETSLSYLWEDLHLEKAQHV